MSQLQSTRAALTSFIGALVLSLNCLMRPIWSAAEASEPNRLRKVRDPRGLSARTEIWVSVICSKEPILEAQVENLCRELAKPEVLQFRLLLLLLLLLKILL